MTRSVFKALPAALVVTVAVELLIVATAGLPAASAGVPTVLDVTAAPYSAAGNGTTNDRAAIQSALDAAAALPGGATVLLPAGDTFLSGSLTVGSNTTLEVDGTLLQSLNPTDYSYTPTLGHYYPASGIAGDLAMFHNLPFIYSTGSENVEVDGTGTVQLAQAATTAATIYSVGIGFYEVDGFTITGVTVSHAVAYSVALYSSNNGLVQATHLLPRLVVNDDGISILDSQHLRITGNTVATTDDATYVAENYRDPRGETGEWWSTHTAEPSTDIEVDHNTISSSGGMAFGFIAWGSNDPNQSEVEISGISVHDNSLTGADAIGCWCSPRYYWPTYPAGQSPISDVTIIGNTYTGAVDAVRAWNGFGHAQVTDLHDDFGGSSMNALVNGDFDQPAGEAWWSTIADSGAADTATAAVLTSSAAQVAVSTLDPTGRVGFVQSEGTAGPSSLYEGISMPTESASLPPGFNPPPGTTFEWSADVITSGAAAELFAYDTCTGQNLASQSVSSTSVVRERLTFTIPAGCGDIQLGINSGAGPGDRWALIDNATVTGAPVVVDDSDPAVTYTGTWQSFAHAADIGGTNMVGRASGATATMSFTGNHVVLYAATDINLGIARIYLDGAQVATVDQYSVTASTAPVVMYDSPILPITGVHTIEIVDTGTKNPASAATYVDFDAMLIENVVPTVIDDSDPAVAYTGTWQSFAHAADIGGTNMVGRASGATATMSFTGNHVVLYAATDINLGIARIYLDGIQVATVDQYSATASTAPVVMYDSPILSVIGTHTIAIVDTGTKNPASAATYVDFDAMLIENVAPTVVDDSATAVTYTGTWQSFAHGTDIGGTNVIGRTTGATATISFTGNHVVLYAGTGSNLGIARIDLDGTQVATVDQYSAATSTTPVVMYDSATLPSAGAHTIAIVETGTKNAASAAAYVDFDSAFVYAR